jgi:hypothetical protein
MDREILAPDVSLGLSRARFSPPDALAFEVIPQEPVSDGS